MHASSHEGSTTGMLGLHTRTAWVYGCVYSVYIGACSQPHTHQEQYRGQKGHGWHHTESHTTTCTRSDRHDCVTATCGKLCGITVPVKRVAPRSSTCVATRRWDILTSPSYGTSSSPSSTTLTMPYQFRTSFFGLVVQPCEHHNSICQHLGRLDC